MCGIAGLLAFDADALAWKAELEQSIARVVRRGPDDEGTWTDGTNCLLGFRRLAVLDLSPTGHQPMADGSGRFVVVCNGEVYNFRELRRELESEGIEFRSTGDAEVVLQAMMRWGTDALRRFNGMFALAFYDAQTKRLILARDHAGMKPLYWMRSARGVVFGSQYDQLLMHPWAAGASVCPSSLALYLHFDHVPAPWALHDTIHMLEPGTWLAADPGGTTRSGRFFSFAAQREPDLAGNDAYDAFDAVLTRAVQRHMVSDVPVGVFLSGGVDSPLVAAVMQSLAPAPVPAFTIGTDGGITDESAAATAYAREIGLEHTVHRVSEGDVLPLLEDAVRACAEPFADYSVLPTLLVSGAARQHVTVALSGDGGDELFWGYVDRAASILETAVEFRRRRPARLLRAALRDRAVRWELLHPTIGEAFQAHQRFLPLRSLGRVLPVIPELPPDFALFAYNDSDVDRTAHWLRSVEMALHLPRVLLKVDRASMYHSLEVRMPLLDREVLDLAARIDWRSCIDLDNRVGKLPLRSALSRRVRRQTVPKRGFTVPMDDWMSGPLRPVFEDAVASRPDILGLPVRRAALRRMITDHVRGRARHGWLFWRLLSLQLWHAEWEASRSRSRP